MENEKQNSQTNLNRSRHDAIIMDDAMILDSEMQTEIIKKGKNLKETVKRREKSINPENKNVYSKDNEYSQRFGFMVDADRNIQRLENEDLNNEKIA
jgi:hypothetical protein